MEEKVFMTEEDFAKITEQMDVVIEKAETFMENVETMQATSIAIANKYGGSIDYTEEQQIQLIAKSNKLDRIILPFVQEVVKNLK